MRRFTIVALSIGVPAIALGGWIHWSRRQPQYSLSKALQAIHDRDVTTFERYVDLEGACQAAISVLMQRSLDESARGAPAGWGVGLGVAMAQLMKPRLVDECRSGMKRGIETPEGGRIEIARSAAVRVRELSRAGRVAVLEVRFSPKAGPRTTYRLKMRDLGDRWQVTELDNLGELAAADDAEAAVAKKAAEDKALAIKKAADDKAALEAWPEARASAQRYADDSEKALKLRAFSAAATSCGLGRGVLHPYLLHPQAGSEAASLDTRLSKVKAALEESGSDWRCP